MNGGSPFIMLYYFRKKKILQFLNKQTKNTVPDTSNYASAKFSFSHPLKMQFCQNSYVQNDRAISREYITFRFSVSHLVGETYF